MAYRVGIIEHLTPSEIDERYRTTEFGVERTHWRIIWLLSQKRSVAEVSSIVRQSPKWVREIAHRYNEGGPAALGDGRHANRGAAPLLDAEGEAALRHAITGPRPDGGQWTSSAVAAWISERLGRPVPVQRGWVYLRRAREANGDAVIISPPNDPGPPVPTDSPTPRKGNKQKQKKARVGRAPSIHRGGG